MSKFERVGLSILFGISAVSLFIIMLLALRIL
jgi:hypothetical protein